MISPHVLPLLERIKKRQICPHFRHSKRSRERWSLVFLPLWHVMMRNIIPLYHMPQQISWGTVSMTVMVNSMKDYHKTAESPWYYRNILSKAGCNPDCECRYCKFCCTMSLFPLILPAFFFFFFAPILLHTSLAYLILSTSVMRHTRQEKTGRVLLLTFLRNNAVSLQCLRETSHTLFAPARPCSQEGACQLYNTPTADKIWKCFPEVYLTCTFLRSLWVEIWTNLLFW